MRNTKWLLAAGLIAATTAACTTDSGYYPNTTSGYYPSTSYNSGYYYPSTASSAYYPSTSRQRLLFEQHRVQQQLLHGQPDPAARSHGDYDRDGIPNRYDRDANGDGVPDRYQR